MNCFEVEGGHSLNGTIVPQGAKNEALQILCAALLAEDDDVIIHNIPDIIDVKELISIIKLIGVKVEKIGQSSYSFNSKQIQLEAIKSEEFLKQCAKLRGSVMLIGALISRFNYAIMPQPGGDKIGRRSISTHLLGLQKLGVSCIYKPQQNSFEFTTQGLVGAYILLDEPSVTGTANVLMAAVKAKGKTTIYNAACEPYLQQLCLMLNNMGAKIKGIGSNLLTIDGVENLKGTAHTIMPDMIEVGSFIGLAAMTQSNLIIKDAGVKNLSLIIDKFRVLGIDVNTENDDVIIKPQSVYKIQTAHDGAVPTLYDHPWPGLTPDLISIFLVTAIHAKGSILIHQKMFESRLFFVDKLIDMGAKIILCDPHRAVVIGSAREYNLRGITMSSPDIRAGVSLLFAALSAEGKSYIHNIGQIERGYQNIDTRLNALGAKIKRVQV